jgi:hypothetical protein
VQIQCPPDCAYLTAAREHPAAAIVRQRQRDISLAVHFMRDFSQRQSHLFGMTASFLVRVDGERRTLDAGSVHPLIDDDVVEAVGAVAATYETSGRGVIYEHRPASLPAQRLVAALKPLLGEAGQGGGSSFERDAAVVMRRFEQAVGEVRALDQQNRRAFLEFLGRAIADKGAGDTAGAADDQPASGLILP